MQAARVATSCIVQPALVVTRGNAPTRGGAPTYPEDVTAPRTAPQQTASQPQAPQQQPQHREPHQSKYQVRLDQGVAGAARVAPGAHVVVVVDVLDGHGLLSTADVLDAVAAAADDAALVLHATAASSAASLSAVHSRGARRSS